MEIHEHIARKYLISALLVAAVGSMIVGSMDHKDAVMAENHYCDMVNEGHWPNFKKIDCFTIDEE
jgi:hypothetical protein